MQGGEPNLGTFHPLRPVSTPVTPTVLGDSSVAGFSNWQYVPTYQMDGSGEVSHNVLFKEM